MVSDILLQTLLWKWKYPFINWNENTGNSLYLLDLPKINEQKTLLKTAGDAKEIAGDEKETAGDETPDLVTLRIMDCRREFDSV